MADPSDPITVAVSANEVTAGVATLIAVIGGAMALRSKIRKDAAQDRIEEAKAGSSESKARLESAEADAGAIEAAARARAKTTLETVAADSAFLAVIGDWFKRLGSENEKLLDRLTTQDTRIAALEDLHQDCERGRLEAEERYELRTAAQDRRAGVLLTLLSRQAAGEKVKIPDRLDELDTLDIVVPAAYSPVPEIMPITAPTPAPTPPQSPASIARAVELHRRKRGA